MKNKVKLSFPFIYGSAEESMEVQKELAKSFVLITG